MNNYETENTGVVAENTHSENTTAQLETHTETSSKSTLFAEPVFNLGNFTVTNSLLSSWLVVIFITLVCVFLRKKIKAIPATLQNIFEMVIEIMLDLCDTVTGDRKKSLKFFPIIFSLAVFILLNNWLGLLPGVGSVGYYALEEGHKVFVPFLRGGTADLNTTMALALFSVIGANLAGFIFVGVWKYINKYLNFKAFISIPKLIRQDATVVLVNPIKAFVGLIEIIGEAAKVASLSFRLFGNVFAGEVLLASMSAIFAFILPIPFMFLEVMVGLIQALIFSVLTLVYLTIATTDEEH